MSIHPLDRPPDDETPSDGGRDKKTSVDVRLIRIGVWSLCGGILATAIGAALLGQGPGALEQPGDILHRGGMVVTLVGLMVVFVGYRWNALVRLFEPPPAAGRSAYDPASNAPSNVRELLETLPLPPGSPPSSERPRMSGPASEQSASMELHSVAASWGEATLVAPPPLRNIERVMLYLAWPLLALVFFAGGVAYWVLPLSPALLSACLLDLLLAAVFIAGSIIARGSRRVLFCGMLLPLLLILLVEVSMVPMQWPGAYWSGSFGVMGGGMGGAAPWKFTHVAIHLLIPLVGCVAWVAARTFELMQGSSPQRRSEPR